jgi:hypothetical protein
MRNEPDGPRGFHGALQEAFFWKQLADMLLEEMDADKEKFYAFIEPTRRAWSSHDVDMPYKDLRKACMEKSAIARESFHQALSRSLGKKANVVKEVIH